MKVVSNLSKEKKTDFSQLSTGKKRILTLLVLSAVLLAVYLFMTMIMPGMKLFSDNAMMSGEASGTIALDQGVVVEQSFSMPFEKLSGVVPKIATDKQDNRSRIIIEIMNESGEVILSEEYSKGYMIHIFEKVEPKKILDVSEGAMYKLRIHADGEEKSGMAVVTSSEGPKDSQLLVNGQSQTGTVFFDIEGRNAGREDKTFFPVFYALFAIIFLLCVDSLVSGSVSLDYKQTELIDKVVVGGMLLYCMLCISEADDLQVIVRGGFRFIDAIGKGKFRDFYNYAYAQEVIDGNFGAWAYNYNILQYLFAAICVLPFRFIISVEASFYLYYMQGIVAGLMVYSGYLLKKAAKDFGFSEQDQRKMSFLFLTSGMAIFSAVGFGQIDIVFIVCTLWALRFYAKKKYYRFSLIMSVAIAFKTFPILIFIPMILLATKKIREILKHLITGLSLMLVTALIFNGTEGYKVMTKIAENEQNFIGKLSLSRIENGGMFGIALFILFFVIICAYAYMKEIPAENTRECFLNIALMGFLVYVDIFCFLIWHIPWLMPMALFTAMLIPFYPKAGRLLCLELVMELMALLVAEIWNIPNIGMLQYGVQSAIWPATEYHGIQFGGIVAGISPVMSDLFFAGMVGVLLYMTVYFVKEAPKTIAVSEENDLEQIPRGMAWGRIGVVALYSVFCIWAYNYIG